MHRRNVRRTQLRPAQPIVDPYADAEGRTRNRQRIAGARLSDGEAASSIGGRPRHAVELQGSYYNNGLGARLTANWRSATWIDSAAGDDIQFGDYTTLDLRLFANLGERFDLVSKNPFFLGSSVRFEIKNLLNEKPGVRGADGLVPFAYQGDRLEPLGRTVSISFRKLFLPARFRRPAGGGRR